MTRQEYINNYFKTIKEAQENNILKIEDLEIYRDIINYKIKVNSLLTIYTEVMNGENSEHIITIELSAYKKGRHMKLKYLVNMNDEDLIVNTIKGINELTKYYNME